MLGDIYSTPEEFGLSIVGSLDLGGGYDWHSLLVWKDAKSKRLYWDEQSGCSCYSPWEDVTSTEKLSSLTKGVGSWEAFSKAVLDFKDYDEEPPMIQKQELLRKVRRLLK